MCYTVEYSLVINVEADSIDDAIWQADSLASIRDADVWVEERS